MTSRTIFNAILTNDMDLFNSVNKYEIIIKDDRRGYSPLFFACMTNKLAFVKRIIEIKKEIEQQSIVSVEDCDDNNFSCLMVTEDISIIKYLISEGANINHINSYGSMINISNSIEITNFLFLIKNKISNRIYTHYRSEEIYKTIIDNPFYYYMRENIKDYLIDMNITNFLYEFLENDIGSIIYANPLKIYNGKFNIKKDDIRYFLNKIKSYKGVQSRKYKEIFISLI